MIKHLPSLWLKDSDSRVFISYRREDTQWFAGRLADSLSRYFGDKRVFRDVDGIEGGADFGKVIRGTLKETDATIILIGNKWLSCETDSGERRLEQADDWVAQEVVTALDAGIPVYPVLVGDTPMPRADELPPQLQPLLRFNAISISDNRWESDISRLAKIIGLDIPSETERKLNGLNLLISLSLVTTLLICCIAMFRNLICYMHTNLAQTTAEQLPNRLANGVCRGYELPVFNALIEHWPLDLRVTSIPYIAILCSCVLLFVYARYVEKSRRSWFLAAGWIGTVGTFVSFVALLPIAIPYESISMLFSAIVIILIMFVFMCFSGFRAQ